MNGKHIRLFAVLLILCMLLGSAAGCVGSSKGGDSKVDGSKDATQGTQETKDPYAPIEGKKYKISWTAYRRIPTPEDAEMIKYYEDMFNVDIDLWNIEHEKYAEILNLRLAGGEIPDLFRIEKPEDLLVYYEQDVLAEIPQEVLRKYAPNIVKVLDEYAPGFLAYGMIEGKQYALPAVSAGNIFRKPLAYRKKWLDNLGVTKTPDTLEEFEELMYMFAHNDPDKNGIKDTYGLSDEGLVAVYGAYGYVCNEDLYYVEKDGKLVFGGVQPEMKEILAMLNKWYKDGVLDPEFVTGENMGGYWALSHAFINGRIGFSTLGNYYHWQNRGDYKTLDHEGNMVDCEPGGSVAEMELLYPDEGPQYVVHGMPLLGPTGKRGIRAWNRLKNFYSIGAYAAEEDGKIAKILEILDYMSAHPDPTVRRTASRGFEGKHWVWADKENEIAATLPPFDEDPDYFYKIGAFLNMDLPFPPKGYAANWCYENQYDKYGIESAIQIGLPAFAKNQGELKKIREEAYIAIITGEKPIDYFDQFVKEYMDAGGQAVYDEVNDWYKANVLKQ